MKQIKLGDIYFKMASEMSKKFKKNINNYLNDLIVEDYRRRN